MMNDFPDLMADLLAFLANDCPTIHVHKTVMADFDAGIVGKPNEEQVNKSALNICFRYLEDGFEMP